MEVSPSLFLADVVSNCQNPITIINPRWNTKTPAGVLNLKKWKHEHSHLTPIPGYPKLPEDGLLAVPCGKCPACIKRRSSDWTFRLIQEQIHTNTKCTICTLTFSQKNLPKNHEELHSEIRSFCDRMRDHMPDRKSPRRWFCTELGEEKHRLHLHGAIWSPLSKTLINKCWTGGFTRLRPLKSVKQLAYAAKYATKQPVDGFRPRVFVSPGLGSQFINTPLASSIHLQAYSDNPDLRVSLLGRHYALPRYYREKLFDYYENARIKRALSLSIKPFEKNAGRTSYQDERSYRSAKNKLKDIAIRQGYIVPNTYAPDSLLHSAWGVSSDFPPPPPEQNHIYPYGPLPPISWKQPQWYLKELKYYFTYGTFP